MATTTAVVGIPAAEGDPTEDDITAADKVTTA